MIKRMLKYFSRRADKKQPDALFQFVTNVELRKNKNIVEEAIRLANEEQRKIYYGTITR